MSCCNGKEYGKPFCDRREGPSDEDVARLDQDDATCPECGAEIYFDAPLCSSCGHAMRAGDGIKPTGVGKVMKVAAPLVIGVLVVTLVLLSVL